jgi:hypothetical protein
MQSVYMQKSGFDPSDNVSPRVTSPGIAIHRTADIIGEADPPLSRTRAKRAPALPVLCILGNGDPAAKLAAKR